MKKINIELTNEDTRTQLKVIAAENKIPMKELASKVLDTFIKEFRSKEDTALNLVNELQSQAA